MNAQETIAERRAELLAQLADINAAETIPGWTAMVDGGQLRRAAGGTVYIHRRPGGRWVAAVSLGYDRGDCTGPESGACEDAIVGLTARLRLLAEVVEAVR